MSIAIFKVTLLNAKDNTRSWILLALGVISALLALNKNFNALRVAAVLTILSAGEIAYKLSQMAGWHGQPRTQLESDINDVVRASVSADIGVIFLILGICALLYAAFKEQD